MHTHKQHIASRTESYSVQLSGSLDGPTTRDPVGYSPYQQSFEPNVSVRLENTGDTDLVNPWIIVNGKRDWRSIDHVLGEILNDGMTDAEKARAIWEFARTHRYHYTCASDEVKDTVKMLNVYGYTLCWDEAYTVSNLWQAAGLKVRRGYPHGHCTTEVWYDGAFHLLDSDEHLMYLLRDNSTIASEEDLAKDRDLVKRGHAYGVLQGENPAGAEGASSLFFFTGPRTGGRPRVGDHTMDLTLRPGEALIWEWEDRGKYHGYWDRPKRLANGRMEYAPDLTSPDRWAEHLDGWSTHPEGLLSTCGNATLDLSIRSPYVIVGGSLSLTLRSGIPGDLELTVKRHDASTVLKPVCIGKQLSVDLNACFPPDSPASYTSTIGLRSKAGDVLISNLTIETDLQMAPLSLPALELGENKIVYTADSDGHAEITHTWTEQTSDPSPVPPEAPDHPAHNRTVTGTQFTFKWPAVESAIDYHFQLSDRSDLRYVLSPVFDKLVSKTPSTGKPEWSIPFTGLLNPGQTYHWRVRPRNAEGLWGKWSPIWSFTPEAPGVPLSIDVTPDWDTRTLTLSWQPNPEGSTPVRYEIYASDERGFSISREPYDVVTGNKTSETFPSNLIATTDQTSHRVAGPGVETGNFAFYRVVAVDDRGTRSGPSDMAAAPRPMIVSAPPSTAVAGQTTTYQLVVISSIGELRAERIDNKNYVQAIREGDRLRFLVDEGPPEWVTIDTHTGQLTARPEPKHLGYHTITVRVQNGQGGTDMQGFDLEVVNA